MASSSSSSSSRAVSMASFAAAVALLFFVSAPVTPADAAAKCITYFVKVPQSPFSYKAGFAQWPTTCNPKFYNISKLYMRDSCVADRVNNWYTRPDCSASPGGAASSTSAATCNAVFKNGPAGDFALAASTPASGFDSGNICNPGTEGFFFIVYDDVECNPGKTPPPPKLVATAGAAYRGPSCNRAAFGKGSGSTAYRSGGGSLNTASKKTGVGIGTGILILLLAGGACAAVYFMFRKSQANQAAAAAAGGGVGGGGGVQMSGGAPPPPPPPGSYAPGAPAAGAAAPGAAAAGAAGAAGAAAAAPGGVQYSFAPGADSGKVKPPSTTTTAATTGTTTTAAAAAKPAANPTTASSTAAVPLPGGSDAAATKPGGVTYPKV